MRCSCKACGAYMVQRERGLESGCCCPACGNVCRDCMGSVSGPLDVTALRDHFSKLSQETLHSREIEDTEEETYPRDWRRML